MLVLNKPTYLAWSKVEADAIRYAIRVWLDGFYATTHPVFAFSPFGLAGLARLWPVFLPDHSSDWSKRQRAAIRYLGESRRLKPDGLFNSPPTSISDAEWTSYFSQVEADKMARRLHLLECLRSTIAIENNPINHAAIRSYLATLASELLGEGRVERELFVRVGTGVIDARGLREETTTERFLGLLRHFERVDRQQFLCYTEVLHNNHTPSNRMARRMASLQFETIEEWQAGSGLVRVAGQVFAVSRLEATHSMSALLFHRGEAWKAIRTAEARLVQRGFALNDTSIISLVKDDNLQRWRHSLGHYDILQYLQRPNPTIEPDAFAIAIAKLQEEPELTIVTLCNAFNRQLGDQWGEYVARSYLSSLRRSLTRRMVIALKESHDRWQADPRAPSWLEKVPVAYPIDFAAAAAAIRNSGRDRDDLLADRLLLITSRSTEHDQTALISAYLTLARGIRNLEIHHTEWPIELRAITSYLASLLLHAFVASFPRSPAKQHSGESSVDDGQPGAAPDG